MFLKTFEFGLFSIYISRDSVIFRIDGLHRNISVIRSKTDSFTHIYKVLIEGTTKSHRVVKKNLETKLLSLLVS